MSVVSSNMISKHYCPVCNSFDLVKLHRSFIQKRILDSQHELQCKACGEVFKPDTFERNEPIKVPVFIEAPTTAHATETLEPTDMRAKDKKSPWPYAVASFFVMAGAAYAFMWIPSGLNTESLGVSQVDESIGKPLQQIVDDKQSKVVALTKPEVEQTEVIYELASDESELEDDSSLGEGLATKVVAQSAPIAEKRVERKQQSPAKNSQLQEKTVVKSIVQDLNQLFSN